MTMMNLLMTRTKKRTTMKKSEVIAQVNRAMDRLSDLSSSLDDAQDELKKAIGALEEIPDEAEDIENDKGDDDE